MASPLKSCSFGLLCCLVVGSLVYFVADPALSRVWDVEMVSECEVDQESGKVGQSKDKSLVFAAIGNDDVLTVPRLSRRVGPLSNCFMLPQSLRVANFSRGPPRVS
jgi:hypothetical protein